MNYDIAFAPQLPVWLVAVLIGAGLIPVVWGLARRLRGAILRALAWVLLALALLNPSLLVEDREKLKSVVAIVTDKSSSQTLDRREAQTETVKQALIERFGRLDDFEIREIAASDQISPATDVSTALFGALQSGLKDVPQERIAGAVLITDGQVHDIPASLGELGTEAPIHALITGRSDEIDRRIVITQAPRYGVVGETYEISYRVVEAGLNGRTPVEVSVYLDGELVSVAEVMPGVNYSFSGTIPHGGENIVELRATSHPREITDVNNRVFTTINGIRENLRVLLVSGEPHAGERTWRNLLKSDASVDLVHFTILRPPEKQDGTPISQLSLIAFPTRELFVEKIDEFDLIIFDRYSRRGVLPVLYFDNIARYVRDGGAVLLAAGPEFARQGSIADTPLNDILPALPNGAVIEEPYKPRISETGIRHPVTRRLDGGGVGEAAPRWSRWFRSIGVGAPSGEILMEGGEAEPLLVLERFDEGRVAILLSDHAWLWARGFEGGGPHVQLLRRIAHWLMKEPELEEERLTAKAEAGRLTLTRQTLAGAPPNAMLTAPSGAQVTVPFTENGDGIFSAVVENPETGLYRIENGEHTTLAHVGPPNPREFAEVVSTTARLSPLVEESGGAVRRVAAGAGDLPRLLPIRPGATASGNGWIGFHDTGATVLTGINRISLFAGFLGLAILLFGLAAVWAREGR